MQLADKSSARAHAARAARERYSVYRGTEKQVAREMYLVFGTYISFRVSFPANVTCYKFRMLNKARERHRHVRAFSSRRKGFRRDRFPMKYSLASISLVSFSRSLFPSPSSYPRISVSLNR